MKEEMKIEIKCSKTLYPKLIDLLKIIKILGMAGWSRELILLDAGIKKDKTNSKWYIDGDGSDKLYSIKGETYSIEEVGND